MIEHGGLSIRLFFLLFLFRVPDTLTYHDFEFSIRGQLQRWHASNEQALASSTWLQAMPKPSPSQRLIPGGIAFGEDGINFCLTNGACLRLRHAFTESYACVLSHETRYALRYYDWRRCVCFFQFSPLSTLFMTFA